ncbi:MAG: hypothetical protein JNM63_06320, partial [Spirochaetia bacterium]|nr:hypothetical protein [Spirochaetia bacterium]
IHRHTYKYVEKPAVHNYRWLKRFVELVREVGGEELNLQVQVGTTFDPGPEFALSKFKYEKHPEICLGGTMGHASFVVCYATLHADKERYAGFPNGIPEGTLLGTFLGRQSQHFLKAMNFDYLWLSNGFGFGLETWGMYGAVFNGKEFSPTKAQEVKDKSLLFFDSFRKECPDILLRTRGTNQTTGRDLASDGVPLREIYRNNYKLEPPPNSPWAALNGDFGLELVGWMSHIAEIPGKTYPFRFYIHDLWFVNSPWLDRYGREPHDIHLPLSVSRLDAEGNISLPTDFNLLTVDDTYGNMPEIVPNEVIPHLTENLLTSPDAPGLLTWIYPFDEYHDMALDASRIAEVFFGDWFIRTSVGNGFPLNTVTSTANALKIFSKNPSRFKGTILVAPAALGSEISKALVSFVENGGEVMLYGPTVFADPKVQDMLGLKQGAPVSGECEITLNSDGDFLSGKKSPNKIIHEELSSGGGLTEISSNAEVLATVRSKNEARVYAVSRKDPKWKGGAVTWVRGTNSFALPAFKGAHLPEMRDADQVFYSELLMRYAMRVFGCDLRLEKKLSSQRNPVLTVSRHRNAFYLAGFSPNTNVGQTLRFPDGAPLPLGLETEIVGGRSVFHFPKAWRRECRVFVDAKETQEVS